MLRTIAAALVLVSAGFAGVWTLQPSDAQDRPRPPQPEPRREAPPQPRHEVPPGMHEPRMMQMAPMAGTWEVIKLEKAAILLNTATGETFQLVDGKDGMHWRAIPRAGEHRPEGRPEGRPGPDAGPDKQAQQRMERLRMHAEELERELERVRAELKGEGKRDGKKPDEKKPEKRDEPGLDDLKELLEDVEERIVDLKERIEDSDNEDRRAKMKEELKALAQKAEDIRARIKKAREK